MSEVELGPILDPNDDVKFVDAHRPALLDGDYKIDLTHELADHDFKASRSVEFVVSGPRFSIAGSDIQSTFPPKNASGDFETTLPHMILERATVPWERTALDPDNKIDGDHLPPWIALLVFTEDEIEKHSKIVHAGDLTGGAQHAGWHALLHETTDDPKQPVMVLDLPSKLAKDVIPTVSELPLLTSVRVVNDTRSRAIVVANRLCKPGQRHVAHLVSLEGQYHHIKNTSPNGKIETSYEHWAETERRKGNSPHVRVISLAQWTFHCDESHGDFHKILSSVTPGHLALSGAKSKITKAAIGSGAVPVRHQRGTGELNASWYHGPLAISAHNVAPHIPARHASDLLSTDLNTGMLDISYAAAWQLGRLLALRDPKVGTRLYQWKRQIQHRELAHAELSRNHSVSQDKRDAKPFPLADWFENALGRLAAVPFNYLVPDPAVLPKETIAFFAVDKNWVLALYDGAFSIGRTGKRQQILDAVHKAHLPSSKNEVSAGGHPIPNRSGLLLRSKAVSGWPDLIVDGFDKAGTSLGAPIRFEKMGKDVLFVMFEGQVAQADIHLHPQAMHFGFDGTHKTKITKLHATQTVTTNGKTHGKPIDLRLRDGSRVLDIASKQGATLQGFAKDIGAATSHEFAKTMIEGVPKVTFKTELPND